MKDGDHELCDRCDKCLMCETCTCAAGHGARLVMIERLLGEIVEAVRRHLESSGEVASLIPEQDTDWPDGYDFAALGQARAEECAADLSLSAKIIDADTALSAISAARDLLVGKKWDGVCARNDWK